MLSGGASTNTGWHIIVYHVKIYTHMKYEGNHNDIGMGHFWLNGWGIYDLMGGHFMV